jgi:hypothetical protein
MKKVKIIAGVTWALAGMILIIILFPFLNSFSSSAAKLPFMKINPNYSGGEAASQVVSEGCTIVVRKPVFDWLIGERKNGFVQVDWRGNIPENINDSIDYNLDGIPDFLVKVDRKSLQAQLVMFNPSVSKIKISTKTSYGWAVRVGVSKLSYSTD